MNTQEKREDLPEILVVEDSPTQAEQLRYLLERQHYSVAVAHNGQQALALMKRCKPELIISDIVMPEMSGYDLCRQIKADEYTQDIPVVLLTSLANPEDVLEGLACGADNFITKPYSNEYLLLHIGQILASKSLYKNERVRVGVEILFAGKRRFITANQQQMLTLLISTYEAAVSRNAELIQVRDELRLLNEHLEDLVEERTTALVAEIAQRKQAEDTLQTYSEQLEAMVTERTRALEEAQKQLVHQERLSVLGQLSGSIAHELRTPLGAIKNAVYLLTMVLENPDANACAALDIMAQQTKISEQIIDNLLDFARTREPHKQAVKINQIVKHSLLGIAVPENVIVQHELADLPPVSADPDQLEQIFSNLIRNAVQAMPGGGQLVIKTAARGAEWVTIAVIDTGVGIPPENRARLFEPLFTTKAKGIGLGLALVKMLVEAHGGSIEVQSVVGEGSTFTVVLPVAK